MDIVSVFHVGLTTSTYDLADNVTAKQTANLRAANQQVTYSFQFNRLTAINYPAFPANNIAPRLMRTGAGKQERWTCLTKLPRQSAEFAV